MIRKIEKLENLGRFSAIAQEKDFLYGEQNCNIIFGFNGSGKTTLSNALSFFADNSFISEDEKKAIFDDVKNSSSATVELKLQDGNVCKYPASQHSKKVYVFNSNFITTHVFDGTKGKLKKFSNVNTEIRNETVSKAKERIIALESERNKLEQSQGILDARLKSINQVNSSHFNKTLTDKGKRLTPPDLTNKSLPSETIDALHQKLSGLAADYDLSKKQQDLAVDLNTLGRLVFQQYDLDLNKVGAALNKSVQQLSKEVLEDRINEVKKSFTDTTDKERVEKWFRFGKSVLDSAKQHGGQTKCPICDTDISDSLDDILGNFNGYFDKGYEDFIVELKKYREQLQGAIDLLSQCEANACNFKGLWEKYKAQLNGSVFVNFDFNAIKAELEKILRACDSKLANIQFSFSIPLATIKGISEATIAISRFDNLKNTCLTILSAKKLDRSKIEDEIRDTYGRITLVEFDKADKGGNLNRYKENRKRINAIGTLDVANVDGLLFCQNQLREELKKLKVESKSISKYLKLMGIDHFIVDINEEVPDENIIIKYNSSGTDKNRLRNCLSDGEKTALAFSYFLSKFENECGEAGKCKESIVVIDDPISSLDENRLYSTAYLIRDSFKTVKQLIVLSHNFLFLKFFNSSYDGKINCLFINNSKLFDLPEELKNFESPYFYMFKNIIAFSDGADNDYNNAKKYLPNYIRRVLETFLSFKFAKIVGKSARRSPGLSEFDKDIDGTTLADSLKQDLKNKIARIVKITDQHSHGNAQLTEENFYISEDELKNLSKDAVDIIEKMDSIHKLSVVAVHN